jgi:hypothetical protein
MRGLRAGAISKYSGTDSSGKTQTDDMICSIGDMMADYQKGETQ